jgi:hypothetical protein
MGFLLFIVAYVLYLPLTIINYCLVWKKGYFRDSAITLDKLANREFRTLWNRVLIVRGGYSFGKENETISSALGRNVLLGSLTRSGKVLVWILNQLDENHCLNSIKEL